MAETLLHKRAPEAAGRVLPVVLLLAVLAVCGLTAVQVHAQGAPAPGAAPPATANLSDPESEQIGAPEPYVYVSRGLRDPFTLPPQANEETGKKSILELTPLSDFKLIGIVWTRKGPYARVATQDGTGYTVRRGTRIGQNGGVIRKITRDRIIVEEWDTTVFGERVRVETVLALRPEEVNP